jgi:hypothetical protein
VSWLFFNHYGSRDFRFLYFTASLSGILAILTQTKAIRKLVRPENLLDELIKPGQKETELI